ncbi:MAG: outer membrane protein assembly factor BamA [Bdellovibrionota bacterium]
MSFQNGIPHVEIEPRYQIGTYKFSSQTALRRLDVIDTIKPMFGNETEADPLSSMYETLKNYYHDRGFPNADIQLEVQKLTKFKQYKLLIRVEDGTPCTLSEVQILGTMPLSLQQRIRRRLKMKKGDRCDQDKVRERIKKVKKFLVDQGYRSDSIDKVELNENESQSEAILSMEVNVDQKIFVLFHGNRFSFEREEVLKKSIYFDDEKRFSPSWIESTAVEGIKKFYQSKGYPFVEVSHREETLQDKTKYIHFDIERGPIIRVKKLTFTGNDKISDRRLTKYYWSIAEGSSKKHLYVEQDMELFTDGMISFYNENGFLDVSIRNPVVNIEKDLHRADITFSIDENRSYRLNTFLLSGNSHLRARTILKIMDMKRGDAIDPLDMRLKMERLRDEYRKRGYKYVKIRKVDVSEFNPGLIDFPIEIDEGPRITIGNVYVKGNYSTKEKVITRELSIRSGDLYNPVKIRESRRNLLRLGFFSSVIIQEREREGEREIEDLVVIVEERKKRSLIVRPGLSTDDGARISTSFGYSNIAGTGRSASISGRLNRRIQDYQILEHRLVFTYIEPNILGFFDGKFNYIDERIEEIQFDIDRRSLILGLEKQWIAWMRTSVQWELEFRTPFNEDPDVVLSPFDQTQARFGSISTLVDMDFRDNILNATRGSFHRLRFDVFDKSFLSDAEFMRVNLRNSFYMPIHNRIRSILAVRAGFSGTFGNTSAQGISQIPIEKRFRLGGNDSLRGFSRNCVGGLGSGVAENCSSSALTQAPGGNSYINYLLEFLFPLGQNLDLALFTDGGNAFESNREFNPFNIRNSVGFGFRYNTFVGPLRIDFGFPLDRRSGESTFEFHLSVGQF